MVSVFLSYSRADRPRAQQVVAALEAGGCSVWWDGLIEGGERFSHATEAALDGADVVVVLWSKTSAKSHWVHDEATRGRDRGRLVPATIDGTPPPLGFGQFQALDLSKWKGKADAAEIAALVRAIGISLGQPVLDRPRPLPMVTGPSRRAVIAGSAAAALAAGGGFAAWKGGLFASAGVPNSVAVLPFRNLSADPEQDYFAEGLAEEIRTALARNPLLKVASSASSEAFGDRKSTAPEIGRRLAVAFILDGSVRRSAETVKIVSELIDGATGLVTWSRTVEVALGAALEAQRKIAATAGQVLTAQVQGSGLVSGSASREFGETNSTAAFEAFLLARNAFEQDRDLASALAKIDTALQIDPDYGAALAERARTLTHMARQSGTIGEGRAHLRAAITAGRRAVSVAPRLAIGFSQLGFAITYGKLSVAEAREPYERSKDLGWNDSHVVVSYAIYLSTIGRFEEALAVCQRAIDTDPLNRTHAGSRLSILMEARKFDLWHKEFSKYIADKKFSELDTNFSYCWMNIYRNRIDEAEKLLEKIEQKTEASDIRAIVAHKNGDNPAAEKWLNRALASSDYQRDAYIGLLRAGVGQKGPALDALEKAHAAGDWLLIEFYHNPLLDGLRQEARFKALSHKMGFAV